MSLIKGCDVLARTSGAFKSHGLQETLSFTPAASLQQKKYSRLVDAGEEQPKARSTPHWILKR